MRQDFSIGSDGLHLPKMYDTVLDVFFDDVRVWSFAPSRHAVRKYGRRVIGWPTVLRPFLDGTAHVSVREHLSGTVLAEDELAFGLRREPVRVVDPRGRPLAVDKWGRLGRPFAAADDSVVERLLDRMSDVLRALREDCGVPAYLSYGTLLGAIREGRLIAHDNDADVSYLSRCEHPADVAREAFQIQRTLARKGWRVQRDSGFFKVLFSEPDGAVRNIDIFTAFFCEGLFYQVNYVREPMPRSAILPLGRTELEGRSFPAPADPEALLGATYGEGWRVPDPAFRYQVPPATRRRVRGWLGGHGAHRMYWQRFYRNGGDAAVPSEPSAFARWVSEHDPGSAPVLDVGSGNGRDALWFAHTGRKVLGLDYSSPAIMKGRAAAKAEAIPARFRLLDLYDLRQVLVMGARLGAQQPRTMYARFLLHALEDDGRRHLWRLAEMALRAGGRLYLEFRTTKDAEAPHVFDVPFRRFLDPDVVVDEIAARGGRVEYREEGHGLAPFQDEDPHVCRLVAAWQR